MREGKPKFIFPLFCLSSKLETPRSLNYALTVGEEIQLTLLGNSVLECCFAHGAVLLFLGSLRSYPLYKICEYAHAQ